MTSGSSLWVSSAFHTGSGPALAPGAGSTPAGATPAPAPDTGNGPAGTTPAPCAGNGPAGATPAPGTSADTTGPPPPPPPTAAPAATTRLAPAAVYPSRSSATSAADPIRSSLARAMHRATSSTSPGSTRRKYRETFGISPVRIPVNTALASPWNGRVPVSISNSTTPSAQMSAR